MKYNVNDIVSWYGKRGKVVEKNPATRKYLVEFPNKEGRFTIYESELTKIEESDD